MKLWVDGQALQSASAYRGIGRYIIELLKAIVKNYPQVSLHMSFNAALPNQLAAARTLVAGWIEEDNIHIWHGAAKTGEGIGGITPERHFSEIMLAHHVAALEVDIAFSVSPFEGGVDVCVPLLKTYGHDFLIASIFYDAIPLRFPDRYLSDHVALECYKRRLQSYSNFDMTLAISEFSDRELRALTDVENSVPIHAGLSAAFKSILKAQKADKNLLPIVDEPYALYVGGFDWRKNVKLIIEAFSLSDQVVKNELSFVIAGDIYEPEEAALRQQWHAAGLDESKLNIIGRVTDEELVNLYTHARFTVQPSYMEGFGLTVLESLACHTPVLASNRGALPEVLGGDSCLFDPSNAIELSQLMKRMSDPTFRDALLAKAAEDEKAYSWDMTAKLAVQALKPLLRKRKTPQASISQRNSTTLRAAKSLNLKRSFVAQGLSLATPPLPEPGRILVDTTSTTNHNHGTGIQRVVTSIAKHLLDNERGNINTQLIYCDDKRPFSPVCMNSQGKLKVSKRTKRDPIIFRSNDIILMLDSSWQFHSYHKHYLMSPKLRGTRIYSVLYDMVPLLTPGFCDQGMSIIFSKWMKDALEYSDGFICISKAVADEFQAFLKAVKFPRPMKIGYWHLGANFSNSAEQTKISNFNADHVNFRKKAKNYLMVGTLEPRKGHRVAIKAFSSLWDEGHEGVLTIVGKKGWAVDALAQSIKSHPEYNKKLFWYSAVDDAQLTEIYKKSDVLIAASFSEGFGLPIIEAANLNIPVIASNIPVFREVSQGHDVRFFDCGDANSLLQLIKTYNDPVKKQAKMSSTQAPKILTWQESTNALLNVIQGQNWYIDYKPVIGLRFNDGDIGDVGTSSLVPPAAREHEITIVEGPYASNENDKMTCIVRLVNLSKACWSPDGPNGTHEKGVVLCARMMKDDHLIDEGIRVRIPLTVIPNTPYYFAVNLPKDDLLAGKRYKIELLQEGVSWWGNGVEVKLDDH